MINVVTTAVPTQQISTVTCNGNLYTGNLTVNGNLIICGDLIFDNNNERQISYNNIIVNSLKTFDLFTLSLLYNKIFKTDFDTIDICQINRLERCLRLPIKITFDMNILTKYDVLKYAIKLRNDRIYSLLSLLKFKISCVDIVRYISEFIR